MSALNKPYFHNEAKAFAFVDGMLWANRPVCPHCGTFDKVYAITPNPGRKVRMGLKKCGNCKKQFTVRVGTIFEHSHFPLHKWLQAIFLMYSSKKDISSHQLMRVLEVTYKTAWFLSHRIRETMRENTLAPFGGDVEVDETYFGQDPDEPKQTTGSSHKMKVLSLIDRSTGRARSIVMDTVTTKSIGISVAENMAHESRLLTDQASYYLKVGKTFTAHASVNHSKDEYVSKLDPTVHTNTVEGFFSIFKRGMRGVYQHCSKKHLHRYLAEFDFRYSNRVALGVDDRQRALSALRSAVGKRLTYRWPGRQQKLMDC